MRINHEGRKEFQGRYKLEQACSFLKIGLIGAFLILVGDFLMGWGVKDESLSGIESQVSQYLTVSDSRMFCSSLLGLVGVPFACLGHFGIYKLIKLYSQKYSKMYMIGGLGFWLSEAPVSTFLL